MWIVKAYKFWNDFEPENQEKDKPSVIVKKDTRQSAEFIGVQLNNKYCLVDVLTPEGFSCTCYYNGGCDSRLTSIKGE